MSRQGQMLVELALTLPFIMLLIIGATETGFLLIKKADLDRRAATVAEWIAEHPDQDWSEVADYILNGCEVAVATPLPDLLEVQATCQYQPVILRMWDGLPISMKAQSATSPTPTPAPSPSSS